MLTKLLIVVLVFTLLVVVLELAARRIKCPTPPPGDIALFSEYWPSREAHEILSRLREKRRQGQDISRADYRAAFEKVIYEIPTSRMGVWFGVVPKTDADIGFTRNNLPPVIKLLVKRHELEHMLQTGREKNREWSANFAVFKEYPLESPRMIIFAIKDRMTFYRGQPLCLLVNLWQTFRKYLLPF